MKSSYLWGLNLPLKVELGLKKLETGQIGTEAREVIKGLML